MYITKNLVSIFIQQQTLFFQEHSKQKKKLLFSKISAISTQNEISAHAYEIMTFGQPEVKLK